MAIPEMIKKLADDIRSKVYGREVREALAKGIEEAGNIADEANTRSIETKARQDDVERRWDDVIQNVTTTDPSSVEIVDARGGYTVLRERLDAIDLQMTNKADKTYVDDELIKKASQSELEALKTQFQNIGDGSPKGVFPKLADLQAAYPSGATGIYIVTDDGKWYFWNGSAWTAGGVYQGTKTSTANIEDGAVTRPKLHPYMSGFNNNRIELTYENGLLTRVTEKDGDITVSRQILSYDENNRLVQVEEQANGKRIITTLIYYNDGRLSYTQNTIEE